MIIVVVLLHNRIIMLHVYISTGAVQLIEEFLQPVVKQVMTIYRQRVWMVGKVAFTVLMFYLFRLELVYSIYFHLFISTDVDEKLTQEMLLKWLDEQGSLLKELGEDRPYPHRVLTNISFSNCICLLTCLDLLFISLFAGCV